ncbi:FP2 [Symbiodinium sp. KB8]|nr:FP2 [Symbiodinium sp. KB8]
MQGARVPKFRRARRGGRKLLAALLCGLFLRMLPATSLFVHRPGFRGQKPPRTRRPAAASSDESRDAAFMERLHGLAREALAWPFLEEEQRLVWAAVLEFDAALPPWFFERHNFTRRRLGVDLFSLDGQQALLCRAGNATNKDAPCCTLWTDRGCNVSADSQRWLKEYGGRRKSLTKKRVRQLCCDTATSVLTSGQASAEELSDPRLRPCQEACLEACARGARVIEMACGTGKTRVIRELATKQTGKARREHSSCSWYDAV